MRKKINYLKQIYKYNPETDTFIIEVSLDNYNEVFNGWDPSPIRRRDIDPELLDYIEQCANDIPLNYAIELNFHLPKEQYDTYKEKLTYSAIINNFRFIIHSIRRTLIYYQKRILIYIAMSFIFLTMAYLLRMYEDIDVVTTIFVEGLYIGGWVFLWEAFSLFFFSGQEIKGKLKRYNRYINSPIHFLYYDNDV